MLILVYTSLNPFLEADDFAYHLTVPRAWLNAGRIFPTPLEPHANFHYQSELSYLQALALTPGSVITAKLMETFRCIAAAFAAAELARVLSPAAGIGLRATAFSLTILLEEFLAYGTVAHVDAGISLPLTVGCIWVVMLLESPGSRKAALCAGLMLGSVIAVKQTGVAMAVPLAFLTAAALVGQSRSYWPPVLLLMAGLAVSPAPWILKNWWFTGNPVFPFLLNLFPASPLQQAGNSFFLSYYPDMGGAPLAMLIPGLAKTLLLADYAAPGNLNNIIFLIPLACLLTALPERIPGQHQRLVTILFSVYLMMMLYLFLQSPFRRFMIALYPLTIVLLSYQIYLKLQFKKLYLFIFIGLQFLSLQHFIEYKRLWIFGDRKFDQSITLTPASVDRWYRRNSEAWPLICEMNRDPENYGGILVTLYDPAIPVLLPRFVPNVPVVSLPALPALRNAGFTDREIAAFLEESGIRLLLTRAPSAPEMKPLASHKDIGIFPLP